MPAERHDTIRRQIVDLIEEKSLSAKEISAEVGIPEKDVYGHMDHIHKSVERDGRRLDVIPAECIDCGFVFRKRGRLTKPGRCPVCKSESINFPSFSISGKKGLSKGQHGQGEA